MAAILKMCIKDVTDVNKNKPFAFLDLKYVGLDTKIVVLPILEVKICKNKVFMAAILKMLITDKNYVNKKYPNVFLGLKNVCLDTKIVFLPLLKAKIWTY